MSTRRGLSRCVGIAFTCLALAPVTARAARTGSFALAESLYVRGQLAAAESVFATLRSAPGDSTIALRRASLALLRNDLGAARARLEPVLAKHPVPRSANVMLAEACVRELDFARAVPVERALGGEPTARQLESFAGVSPYRYEGPDRVTIKFVQTDPLPVLEMKVNGRGPWFFLIDTGGAQLAVDPVLADSLGCPRFGDEMGTFAGGLKRSVTKSAVTSLSLGEATFHDVPASLLDCSRFTIIAGGRRVMGVLGTLVLMRMRATLDYPGGALVLERRTAGGPPRPATDAPDSARYVMPIWLAGDHYVLARGRLAAGPEGLWFVDTGLAGAGVRAPASALVAAGIPVPDTSSGHTGVGGGGNAKFQMFGVPGFALGGASATGLIGFFGPFPGSLEYAFGPRIAGIISHGFLRTWRVTFDFDAMQLVLERPPGTRP